MGGKIWVDLDCKLMHFGQHLFGGDLAELALADPTGVITTFQIRPPQQSQTSIL
jgi:hypothetical protein